MQVILGDIDSMSQTKGMRLEDISVLFGDPVELSLEQALHQENTKSVGRQDLKIGLQQVHFGEAVMTEEVKA